MALDSNGECKLNICALGDESRNIQSARKEEIWAVNIRSYIVAFLGKVWKLGKEDSRRVIHSMKVGLALSLVSLLYLMDPLFNGVGVGDNAIWAVMTVVVVHEFTAGATLSKGLNRGFGTLTAGSLAIAVSYLSEKVGEPGEAILIGFTVFALGAAASFSRFFPVIKRRYDYGVVIFILTFSLIIVSGYRVDDIFRMAHQRLSTIAIGCGVCLITSLLVYPIWAGEDLHNSTAEKFEGLATSLEVCVQKYFDGSNKIDEDGIVTESEEDLIYEGYKTVLDCKAIDESLATFASWEPRHGRFRHGHPWKHYVKMGTKLRHLAYAIVALHGSLQSEIQTPHSVRSVLKKPCTKVSEEASKLLRELSCSIRQMRRCDSESMMRQLKLAVDDLHTAFRAQPKLLVDSRRWHIEENGSEIKGADDQLTKEEVGPKGGSKTNLLRRVVSLQPDHEKSHTQKTQSHAQISANAKPRQSVEYTEALPLATFAWLVVEVVARVEHVVEAVEELGSLAHFKACKPSKQLTRATTPQTPKQTNGRIAESHVATQYATE